MSTPNKIKLTSSEGESFFVDEAVARKFEIVANMIEDDCASGSIPLINVAAKDLGAAIEYCKTHVEAGAVENNEEAAGKLKKWDEDFLAKYDNDMLLFDLLFAANYLNCKGLLELTYQKVADNIKDLQPEEVRTMFNMENDYSEEEEAKVRKEKEWAFN